MEEMTQVKQAMVNVFMNHCGNWLTESVENSSSL